MPDNETENFPGIEIWSTGTYSGQGSAPGGDNYTEDHLDDMVRAYSDPSVPHKIPLTPGHQTAPGTPAIGWIENVRRVGGKLLADINNVPKKIGSLIRAKAYQTLSPEVIRDYKNGSTSYKAVLWRLALLGAEIPANSDIGAFTALYDDYSKLKISYYHQERNKIMPEPIIDNGQQMIQYASENSNLKAQNADLEIRIKRMEESERQNQARHYEQRLDDLLMRYSPSDIAPGKILPAQKEHLRRLTSQAVQYAAGEDRISVLEAYLKSLPDATGQELTSYSEKQASAGNPDESMDRKVSSIIENAAKNGSKISYGDAYNLAAGVK